MWTNADQIAPSWHHDIIIGRINRRPQMEEPESSPVMNTWRVFEYHGPQSPMREVSGIGECSVGERAHAELHSAGLQHGSQYVLQVHATNQAGGLEPPDGVLIKPVLL